MATRTPHQHLLWQIGLVSMAALFFEMVLIRWVAAEVRIFAYMHNLLLIACFFGIGLGCFRGDTPPAWVQGLGALALLTGLVTDPLRLGIGEMVTQGLAAAQDTVVWAAGGSWPLWVSIPLILTAVELTVIVAALTALALQPFGQLLGAWLSESQHPVAAYSANLIGSLAGVWGYFGLCAVSTEPVTWLVIGAVLTIPLLVLSPPQPLTVRVMRQALLVVSVALVAVASFETARRGVVTIWSPYQKLDVTPLHLPPRADVPGQLGEQAGYVVKVNNVGYQAMLNLSETFRAARPDIYNDRTPVHYDLPYRVLPAPGRVLVVGAGTGNDVAAALRHGAMAIDAVDIDPVIMGLGVRLHPERPYDSPRVHRVVADARSFFKQGAPGGYDLVWFGLLDSHTTASGYSTLRLDHYVYTRESFREARRLLRPGGHLVCIFDTRRSWISDRIYELLRQTFDGVPPVSVRVPSDAYSGWGGEVFIAGMSQALDGVRAAIAADPELARYVREHETRHGGGVRVTTDDWPYLYLPDARIPNTYVFVSVTILLAFFLLRRRLFGGETISWPFFFLGAAFLLLEVLGVSRAALLLGNTWVVTAVVITGVLTMALLANVWVARHESRSWTAPLIGIVVSGLALVLLPLDRLAFLPSLLRAAAAGIFVSLPMYFSGLLFTRLYRETPDPRRAFGSNLFGAIAGGLCEQLSFVFGIRSLTAFAILLYLMARLSLRGCAKA